jgi:hypothetical protein
MYGKLFKIENFFSSVPESPYPLFLFVIYLSYMKYILTESRLNNTIENYLVSNYDYIVSVSFQRRGVWLASEDRRIERTVIVVIVDPHKVLEGNLEGEFNGYNSDIRSNIWRNLNEFFSLGFDEYGSEWDIEVYGVKLVTI